MWIARDSDGVIRLFQTKPYRRTGFDGDKYWHTKDMTVIEVPTDWDLGIDITWEDEPIGVNFCIDDEKYHTVKLDTLTKIVAEKNNLEDAISNFNALPWYKRLFKKNIMWLARNKDNSLILAFEKPIRSWEWVDDTCMDKKEFWSLEHNPNICLYNHKNYPYHQLIDLPDSNLFTELKWEDEPLEVDIVSIHELSETQRELKDVYHELLTYKTNQIIDLTGVYRGVAIENSSDVIREIEDRICTKYKMKGNPYCSINRRKLTIAHSEQQINDNFLDEYIVDDKVVATVYGRRNDFNSLDLLITDFGMKY